MKTKLAIAGLAFLVGGFFLLTNRPESPTQSSTVATATSKPHASPQAPKKSYGGSFRIKEVTIADGTQPAIQHQP